MIIKITDNGYPPCGYRDKHYRDEADADPEMGYDANGNMVYDLDRGISAVRYNRLNLPDTVQFANGSQIVHSYNALGRRLATTYYTRKVATAVPVGTTLAPSANLSDYNVLNYAYNDNMVYIDYNNHGLWELDYVHTPVGYVRYYGPEEHYPFYYIRDHLGNIRESWVYSLDEPISEGLLQRTQYYPSGLPWNLCTETNFYPYRYNGKEFVEMHGLDEYDSEARWYYPAIMRTTTMDPLCEEYPDISPYAWCGNNPVKNVDNTGLYIEVAESEDSTYIVTNGKPNEDYNIYVVNNDERTGEILGTMFSKYSFFDNDNHVVKGAKIDLTDQSGNDFLIDFINNTPDIRKYISDDKNVSGRNNGMYDFKSKGIPEAWSKMQNMYQTEISMYHNRGMFLSTSNGVVIGTARDVGNFTAGYIAGVYGIPFLLTKCAFNVYQKGIEPNVSRVAQNKGFFTGYYQYLLNRMSYEK